MEIYRIFNIESGKSYIGQTTRNFKQRYWGKWYNSTGNQYLKNSVKKYGENKFSVQILEKEVSSFEELDRLEKYYIQKYNSLCPNGYNFFDGGNSNHKHHEETKMKIKQKMEKEYWLIDFKGNEYHIKGLKDFCKINNLMYAPMKNMVQGQCYSSQGYALKGTDVSLIKNPNKTYSLKNLENGEISYFTCIRAFSRSNKLNHEKIQRLVSGKRKTPYKNWVRIDMDLSRWELLQSFIGKKLISPNGIIYELKESPYEFAKKHPPLDRKDVYMLIKKQTKQRKGGWKLYE